MLGKKRRHLLFLSRLISSLTVNRTQLLQAKLINHLSELKLVALTWLVSLEDTEALMCRSSFFKSQKQSLHYSLIPTVSLPDLMTSCPLCPPLYLQLISVVPATSSLPSIPCLGSLWPWNNPLTCAQPWMGSTRRLQRSVLSDCAQLLT